MVALATKGRQLCPRSIRGVRLAKDAALKGQNLIAAKHKGGWVTVCELFGLQFLSLIHI